MHIATTRRSTPAATQSNLRGKRYRVALGVIRADAQRRTLAIKFQDLPPKKSTAN